MLIQNIFTNFLAHEFLHLDIDNIEKCCYDLLKSNNVKQLELDLNEGSLQPLYSMVHQKFNELHTTLGFSDNTCQRLYNGCINLNNNEYIDTAHSHPRNFFTAVFYVKCSENSGHLNMMTPIPSHCHVIPTDLGENVIKEFNEFNSTTWRVKPEVGKLIIFPAWIVHQVTPSFGGDRISIAFNSRMIYKDNTIIY